MHDRTIIVFSGVYMLAALVSALFLQNDEFVFYFVVMCLMMGVTWGVHRAITLHPLALWGLSLWGLVHMAGGLVPIPEAWPRLGRPVLYNLWLFPGLLKYDQLVHAYGFGLMTWVCWQGLQRAFAAHQVAVRPTPGLLALCIAGANGFGALNEVIEFIASLTIQGTNVGGYENTGWDLVSNLVGSLFAAAMISRSHCRAE